ncbi:sensor histidine kinase [Frisingicoccus sp.]|uniref:sensor histidine kinase n=1 Tax=Frisingicoccus sp. TaxID=1918627 RepID=UPI003AB8152D
MEKLKYIIEDSTIAEVLGVQNFTNEESAVLELVKNAYDAQSLDVIIVISKEHIIIEDNGTGMNRQKILDAWMHVGRSDKKYIVGEGEAARVLAGSKGVGRFAIARLGAKASVYTKMEEQEAVLWRTDWNTNTLETYQEMKKRGTKIVVEHLRDNWTESRVRNLREFLSRTYNDDKMKIQVEYKEDRKTVMRYFGKIQLGINCVSLIKLQYLAKSQRLVCDIESDEFKENVKELCPDIDIKAQKIELNIVDELDDRKNDLLEEATIEEWKKLLEDVGNFSAELYFSLKKPSTFDAEKYFYKHRILDDRYEAGVVLYRNAFSISSYEGKKDWLGFGKRSRKSPAAASHPTGSWRVRENQMSGKVIIDKKENRELSDLINRQGLMENDIYKVFIEIIIAGINCFERYRQSIVRCIANSYDEPEEKNRLKVIDSVMKNPEKLTELSSEEKKLFLDELEQMKKENKANKNQMDETERRYKYDIRLLNMLATSGLKATSIAHEMHNDRNSIDENVDYIIKALKRYELWDVVSDSENTKYMHRDIPALLEKNRRVNRKIVTFMDVMLSESEKEQFVPENINIYELLENIKSVWEKDYSWIDIQLHVEEGLEYKSAKDIFRVIFDNLILNSIQQNDAENILKIHIYVENRGRYINMVYMDRGKGLSEKYKFDPMRILEVHETSRKKGHGIGMWIVNNTIVSTGGKIQKIEGFNGFKIEFTIGDQL